jgi:hypothetical protein
MADDDVEDQIILRLPQHMADTIHLRLREGKDLNLEINVKDAASGIIRLDGQKHNAALVNLPCIIESQKNFNGSTLFKSGDISQMLVVPENSEELNTLLYQGVKPRELDPKELQADSGITPYTRNIFSRRFAKRMCPYSKEDIQKAERTLRILVAKMQDKDKKPKAQDAESEKQNVKTDLLRESLSYCIEDTEEEEEFPQEKKTSKINFVDSGQSTVEKQQVDQKQIKRLHSTPLSSQPNKEATPQGGSHRDAGRSFNQSFIDLADINDNANMRTKNHSTQLLTPLHQSGHQNAPFRDLQSSAFSYLHEQYPHANQFPNARQSAQFQGGNDSSFHRPISDSPIDYYADRSNYVEFPHRSQTLTAASVQRSNSAPLISNMPLQQPQARAQAAAGHVHLHGHTPSGGQLPHSSILPNQANQMSSAHGQPHMNTNTNMGTMPPQLYPSVGNSQQLTRQPSNFQGYGFGQGQAPLQQPLINPYQFHNPQQGPYPAQGQFVHYSPQQSPEKHNSQELKGWGGHMFGADPHAGNAAKKMRMGAGAACADD